MKNKNIRQKELKDVDSAASVSQSNKSLGKRLHSALKGPSGSLSKSFMYTLTANVSAMTIMAVLTFILPRMISKLDYSFWALYILYSQYIGYATLGISDGLYLRFGGQEYHEVPKDLIAYQLRVLFVFHVIFDAVFLSVYYLTQPDTSFWYVALFTCLSGLVYVPRVTVTTLFQATNRLKDYSVITIFERAVLLFLVVGLLILGYTSFLYFVIADFISKLAALVYSLILAKDVIRSKAGNAATYRAETLPIISSGMKIVIANFSSILINGVVRQMIQSKWGIESFGYVSLSFTLSNVIMTIILAVSIVFFPYLKKIDESHYTATYDKISKMLTILVTLLLFFYYPMKLLLTVWLPQYELSIRFLALLFPMTLYESRFKLLVNNYFKALRYETALMTINVLSVALAAGLAFLTTQIAQSLELTVLVIFVVIAARCVVGELLVYRIIRQKVWRDILSSSVISAIFILSAWYMEIVPAFFVFASAYTILLLWMRRKE